MKIQDNRTALTKKQMQTLKEELDAIDKTNYSVWGWEDEPLILYVDRNIHRQWPFNHLNFLKRRDFKIELSKDGRRAEIYVYCRGPLHGEYDQEYLERLGAFLEKNHFEVTGYLLEDC